MKRPGRLIAAGMSVLALALCAACGEPQTPAGAITPTTAPTHELIPPVSTTAPTTAPTTTQPAAAATAAPEAALTTTTQPIVPRPTSTATTPLSKTGPWLVYQTDQGVMAANPDGSGQRLITNQPILRGDLPAGGGVNGWLALRIGARSLADLSTVNQTVTLTLVHLPDGQIQPITPLFSPEMQQALAASGYDRTDATEAGIAIVENGNTLKWSPDGRYLAFIAAIDGPSSDVYSYDMRTGQINRLTDGPNQAANLSWSPDSQWIVHEEVESFGTGAGWNVKAVWAAAPDGNQTRKIYDAPQYSGGEQIIGWTAPDTFIAYTWRTMGPTAVREINVNTGAATPIELAILTQGDWIDLVWSSLAEQFYLYTANSVSGVGWNDQVTRFAQEALLPAVSPDGQHLAFWINSRYGSQYGQRDGLRVYALDGRLQHSVSDQPVDFATWRPDSSGLYFLSDGVLYYAALPAGQITPITDRVQITFEGGLGWVQP